ncbi:hypothetical protein J6590_098710, partial [Homalodisca vitripennis]
VPSDNKIVNRFFNRPNRDLSWIGTTFPDEKVAARSVLTVTIKSIEVASALTVPNEIVALGTAL